jgi:hypothetical protein
VAIQKQQLHALIAQNRQSNVLNTTAVINIPVVVHIVYKNDYDSISKAQINLQIARLNEDFNNLHSDLYKVPAAFTSVIGNMNLKFILAKSDPNNNPTNGIEYKKTNRNYNINPLFNDDFMKKSSTDGLDAWDATKYLNIWVCNIEGGIYGYSTKPELLASQPQFDGVVVSSLSFGIKSINNPKTNYGRTLTHEVGHWLGLPHVWADDEDLADKCSADDDITDTPKQSVSNEGLHAPNYIHISCSNGPAGDMWMNFMDYCDHLNRYLFTQGQVERTRAVLNSNRIAILSSNKHLPPIHQISNTPVFATNEFTAIAVGKDRNIWAGTNRLGLYKLGGTAWAKSNGSLDTYRINQITSDKNGGIWIAEQGSDFAATAYASGGGVMYYADGSIFTGRRYFSDNATGGLASRSARSVFIDTSFNSTLPRAWVASMNQLNQIDDTPERGGLAVGIGSTTPYFTEITAGLDNTVINSGTYAVGGNKNQVFVYATSNFGKPQIVVYNAVSSAIITAYDATNTAGALPTNFFARAIYGDVNGNKWVGLDAGGVSFANATNTWKLINYPTIFASNSSVNNNAIVGDNYGNVFIGTNNGLVMFNGVNVNDVNNFRLFTTLDGLPSNNVTALAVDSVMGKIIIGTNNGITYWDKDCLMKSCEPIVPKIVSTTKNGSWTDPTVWNTGQVPDCNTIVMVNHALSVNTNSATCHSIYAAKGSATTIANKVTITGGKCN